jgi:hypothetical protein
MSQPVGVIKMSVMTLEDVIVEAATDLAMSGEIDVPVDNSWDGVDVVAAGTTGNRSRNFVRIALQDGTLYIHKFENFGVAASASFNGQMVSSSVLVAVVKEWL